MQYEYTTHTWSSGTSNQWVMVPKFILAVHLVFRLAVVDTLIEVFTGGTVCTVGFIFPIQHV